MEQRKKQFSAKKNGNNILLVDQQIIEKKWLLKYQKFLNGI